MEMEIFANICKCIQERETINEPHHNKIDKSNKMTCASSEDSDQPGSGGVARSEACPLGMQVAPSSILKTGTFFCGELVMRKFLRPFSLFR